MPFIEAIVVELFVKIFEVDIDTNLSPALEHYPFKQKIADANNHFKLFKVYNNSLSY